MLCGNCKKYYTSEAFIDPAIHGCAFRIQMILLLEKIVEKLGKIEEHVKAMTEEINEARC